MSFLYLLFVHIVEFVQTTLAGGGTTGLLASRGRPGPDEENPFVPGSTGARRRDSFRPGVGRGATKGLLSFRGRPGPDEGNLFVPGVGRGPETGILSSQGRPGPDEGNPIVPGSAWAFDSSNCPPSPQTKHMNTFTNFNKFKGNYLIKVVEPFQLVQISQRCHI